MPSRQVGLRFRDIVDNIDRIRQHTAGMTEQQFLADAKTLDAVERCLARISEAAIKLGADAEQLCPHIPWRDIRGIGNQLRHGYDAIIPVRVWFTIERDLTPLRDACEPLARLPSDD